MEGSQTVHHHQTERSRPSLFVVLQVQEVPDVPSRVPVEIASVLDLGDVTPDEPVRLPQRLGVCDDLPLLDSRCLWPADLQDKVMSVDDLVASLSIGVASLILGVLLAALPARSVTTTGDGFIGLRFLEILLCNGFSSVVSLIPLSLDASLLHPSIIAILLGAGSDNRCRSAQEGPPGMYLILRMEANTRLLCPERAILNDRVQRNGVLRRGELNDVPPLTVSESLEGEEQDEHKREVFKETDPRRDDDPFPVHPRDPEGVVWQAA